MEETNESSEIEVLEELKREDEESDNDYELECLEYDGRFKTSFHVNKVFFPKILGTDSSTKLRMEKQTNTEILVPEDTGGNIEIIGSSRKSVIECRNNVEKAIKTGKNRSGLTHFLSIPCNHPEVQEKFEKFKIDLLNDEDLKDLDPNIFQNPLKLHQTIFPLILLEDIDKLKAIEYLNDCKQEILDPFFANRQTKLEIKLSGLGIMNEDPKKTNVLYAKLQSKELQELCNQIMEFYIKKWMIAREHKTVKLHMTLMNSVFLMRKSTEPKKKRKRMNLKFDATKILEKYGNYDFGKIVLDEIHLSNVSRKAENGFYEPTAIIKV